MSNNLDMIDKRHVFTDCEDKYACKIRKSDHNYRQVYEYDKKMKREIANSNERRRMQSINSGFETLKELLPMSVDGEKLSKASILQLTAKYIQTLLYRLSSLEKEMAGYKKTTTNKEKPQTNKSPLLHTQDQCNRKRPLNSCDTSETVTLDLTQTKEAYLDCETSVDLGFISLANSETFLLSCENSDKTPGSLEHLVAAIEQVEGERFYVTSNVTDKQTQSTISQDSFLECSSIDMTGKDSPSRHLSHEYNNLLNKSSSNHSTGNSSVMKPTISPYTEKIIRAVSQHPHMFNHPNMSDHHHRFSNNRRSEQSSFMNSDENFESSIVDLHRVMSCDGIVIDSEMETL